MPPRADCVWEYRQSSFGYFEILIVGGEPLRRSVPFMPEILSATF
jgi:hypothetical protein